MISFDPIDPFNPINPLPWDTNASTLIELLPKFVEFTAERGKCITSEDGDISVRDAMSLRTLVDRYAFIARLRLSLAQTSYDLLEHKKIMGQAAYIAGAYFCLYVSEIGGNAKPKVTALISDFPILKDFWDWGYLDMQNQLSQVSKD